MKRLTDQENQFQCDQVKEKKMMKYGQEEMKCLKGKGGREWRYWGRRWNGRTRHISNERIWRNEMRSSGYRIKRTT